MSKKTVFIILSLITLFGAALRFYSLGDNGVGFFRDEAALGFSSWSVLKTGADEFGQRLPIIFRSFEVFFMPAYVYLSLPIFFALGPTFFAARALSALSGTILIVISYLISKELFKSERVGILSAFIVSLSPWAIFYSRGAFEGNLALLFVSIGVYLFIIFNKTSQKKFFFLSIFLFVLSMYSYQSPRFVAPLFLGISILLTEKWWKKWKLFLLGALFAFILYLPVLILTSSAAGYHRAVGVSIFSSVSKTPGYREELGSWQKLYLVPKELLSLYFQYFSPNNLFSQFDYNPQRRVVDFSVFYIWQFPLLILGVWKFFTSKYKNAKYLIVWLLLAPIPASLTRDPFHTYRSLLLYFPLSLLVALGFEHLFNLNKKVKLIFLLGVLLVAFYSAFSFMFSLFKIVPIANWKDWDYGYKEISEYIKTEPNTFRIVIDDPNTESYIHFLYNGLIPVEEYQKIAASVIGDMYYTSADKLRPEKVGRFEFKKVDWPSERGDTNTIFIFPAGRLYPSEFDGDPKLKLVKTILSPIGDPAFYIIKTIKPN